MRVLVVVVLLALTQDRAELTHPRTVDATIRAYEIVGLSITTPATLFTPPSTTLASPPPVRSSWNLTIRYADNRGTEYVDVHTEGTDAPRLIRELVVAPGSTSLDARLLQHLITEGKIGPARIVPTTKGKS